MNLFRYNIQGYTPCGPTPDHSQLALQGRRVMVVQLPNAIQLSVAPKGEVSFGWVIGILPDDDSVPVALEDVPPLDKNSWIVPL